MAAKSKRDPKDRTKHIEAGQEAIDSFHGKMDDAGLTEKFLLGKLKDFCESESKSVIHALALRGHVPQQKVEHSGNLTVELVNYGEAESTDGE